MTSREDYYITPLNELNGVAQVEYITARRFERVKECLIRDDERASIIARRWIWKSFKALTVRYARLPGKLFLKWEKHYNSDINKSRAF